MPPKEEHAAPCPTAIELRTKVETLEASDAKQWALLGELGEKIVQAVDKIREDFQKAMAAMQENASASYKELQDKYANRLPLWATFLITALSSVTVGLIVAIVKH